MWMQLVWKANYSVTLLFIVLLRVPLPPPVKSILNAAVLINPKIWCSKFVVPTISGTLATHAISGATTYVKSDEENPSQAKVGDDYSFGFYTYGHFAASYKVEGIPEGLSFNGSALGPLISGTPTNAGSYSIEITGYRYPGTDGIYKTPTYTLDLEIQPADTPWSDVNTQSLDSGWWRSDWFGVFYGRNNGWFYHQLHGWLFLSGDDEVGFWLYDENEGWLFTGRNLHPLFFRWRSNTWIYDMSTDNQRRFWDYQSKSILNLTRN